MKSQFLENGLVALLAFRPDLVLSASSRKTSFVLIEYVIA